MVEARPTGSLVMTGTLEEFSLAEVLQVVALSRQYTVVELHRANGGVLGSIWLKAGRVLAAQRDDRQGRKAFHDMFDPQAETFVVSRLTEPAAYPESLGLVSALLIEAMTIEPAPPSVTVSPPVEYAPRRRRSASTVPVSMKLVRTPQPAGPPRPNAPVVAVVSPKGGVGKTTIALNLGVALAQRGLRTLLIDADPNGDQLSLLGARGQVPKGLYDVIDRSDAPRLLDELVRDTAVAKLRLLPASGPGIAPAALLRRSLGAEWRMVLTWAREQADLVLVDCPAGMFGPASDVMVASSHLLGVLQSEMIASRSVAQFEQMIAAQVGQGGPRLVGAVVNMFHGRSTASVEAFHQIMGDAVGGALFETTIPRSDAFGAASIAGLPVRFSASDGSPSPVAWLFDMLAGELCDRVGVAAAPARAAVERFLM